MKYTFFLFLFLTLFSSTYACGSDNDCQSGEYCDNDGTCKTKTLLTSFSATPDTTTAGTAPGEIEFVVDVTTALTSDPTATSSQAADTITITFSQAYFENSKSVTITTTHSNCALTGSSNSDGTELTVTLGGVEDSEGFMNHCNIANGSPITFQATNKLIAIAAAGTVTVEAISSQDRGPKSGAAITITAASISCSTVNDAGVNGANCGTNQYIDSSKSYTTAKSECCTDCLNNAVRKGDSGGDEKKCSCNNAAPTYYYDDGTATNGNQCKTCTNNAKTTPATGKTTDTKCVCDTTTANYYADDGTAINGNQCGACSTTERFDSSVTSGDQCVACPSNSEQVSNDRTKCACTSAYYVSSGQNTVNFVCTSCPTNSVQDTDETQCKCDTGVTMKFSDGSDTGTTGGCKFCDINQYKASPTTCAACGTYTQDKGNFHEDTTCTCNNGHATNKEGTATESSAGQDCKFCVLGYFDFNGNGGTLDCQACSSDSTIANQNLNGDEGGDQSQCSCDPDKNKDVFVRSAKGCIGCLNDYRYVVGTGTTVDDHTCSECINSENDHSGSPNKQRAACDCNTGYSQNAQSTVTGGAASCIFCDKTNGYGGDNKALSDTSDATDGNKCHLCGDRAGPSTDGQSCQCDTNYFLPGTDAQNPGRNTDTKDLTCDACAKTHVKVGDATKEGELVCQACHVAGSNDRFNGHQELTCDCKEGYGALKCDKCAVQYYDTGAGSNGVTCAVCSDNGSNDRDNPHTETFCDCKQGYTQTRCDACAATYYAPSGTIANNDIVCSVCNTEGVVTSTGNGNEQRTCGTCKASHGGDTGSANCGTCHQHYYKESGTLADQNLACDPCFQPGTKVARLTVGQHTLENCLSAGSCNDGYFSDSTHNRNCDKCSQWYYKDGASMVGECKECKPGTDKTASNTAAVSGTTGHLHPNCGLCQTPEFAAMHATGNKDCGLCSNEAYSANGDGSDCDMCNAPGTAGQANKATITKSHTYGHTETTCDCQDFYYSDTNKPRCDYCTNEAYTPNNGLECFPCAFGHDVNRVAADGNRESTCKCKQQSFSFKNHNDVVTNPAYMTAGNKEAYSGTLCDTCANSFYKTGTNNVNGVPGVDCEACYAWGTKLGHEQSSTTTTHNMNGNVLDTCQCKPGYFGTTCNQCAAEYYDDDGDGTGKEGDVTDNTAATNNKVSIQCALCHTKGTKFANNGENNDGNTLTFCTCKVGFSRDSDNAKCNHCSANYYDQYGGTIHQVNCQPCHADGTLDSAHTADESADGTTGNENKDMNLEQRCKCKKGYSTTVGTDSGKQCDRCAADYYDHQPACSAVGGVGNGGSHTTKAACEAASDCGADKNLQCVWIASNVGVQCAACYNTGTSDSTDGNSQHGTQGRNPEGNQAQECFCNEYYTGPTCNLCDTMAYDVSDDADGSHPVCNACGNNANQKSGDQTQCDCDSGYYSNSEGYKRNHDVLGENCNFCDTAHYSRDMGNGIRECKPCSSFNTVAHGPRDNSAQSKHCNCLAGYFSSHSGIAESLNGYPCDQCAQNFYSNGFPYNNGGNCTDCGLHPDTAGLNARNGATDMDAAGADICDYCAENAYYAKIDPTNHANGGHTCTACPGTTTTNPNTQTEKCAGSCAASFAVVSKDANGYHVVETCSNRAAGGSEKVNYHNKGGTSVDLRDVVGNDRNTCCEENECTPRDEDYWLDLTRQCGTTTATANTVTGLGLISHNDEYCVSPDGTRLTNVMNSVSCSTKGTWISDGYRPCTIRCKSNGKSNSNPPAAPTDFELESVYVENECVAKNNIAAWNILGCQVDGQADAVKKADLGTITAATGFAQCLITCPVDGNEFVHRAYEFCGADERGNGLECVPCVFGSTNEAGDRAGPLATSCSVVPVDAFMVDDPETSVIDFSSKSSECSNISPFKYAKLHTDGTLKCELCGREAFLESYNANTMDSSVGTRHGICCQNSHHKVCLEMFKEYKMRCEYEDLVATKAANFIGSWYGKGEDASHEKCREFTGV